MNPGAEAVAQLGQGGVGLLRDQHPETFLVLVGFFAVGLLASFIATEILYRLVEWPTHQLARRVAWESPA